MILIGYTPEFFRRLKKLPPDIQEKAFKQIALFRERKNHSHLEVHKLHGTYTGCSSFSIDFRHRVVFEWITKNEARLYTIGSHAIYRP